MLKIIRFIQAPIMAIGTLVYIIQVAYAEGQTKGFQYLAKKYNEDEFK